MQVERLIARIRAQLELGTPDLEARSLATEYAQGCLRARERLEQCATLVRAGDEHAAFQSAEAEPDLLGLCAALSFAEADRWHAVCRERGLPAGFPLDEPHVLAVEGLYGRVIGESHPLYRDYREAIRKRDEDHALAVLRSIVRINPDDPNARSELGRLSAKFLRESLGKVALLFASLRATEAIELMGRMERFGANDLALDARWADALARRTAWLRVKAEEQALQLASAAAVARTGDHWEPCAADLGRFRALERDHQLNLPTEVLIEVDELESWAGGLAAAAEAEARLRAAVTALLAEWETLQQEALRPSSPAILVVRLGALLEQARIHADRLPEGLVQEAGRLRTRTRNQLNRRYLALTSSWVAGLLVVIGALVAANILRQRAETTAGKFSEAVRLIELFDHVGGAKALEEYEQGGSTSAENTARQAGARPLRERLAAQNLIELRLRREARELAELFQAGLNLATVAETRRRAEAYLAERDRTGDRLRARLEAELPEPERLVSACRQFLDRVRNDLSSQIVALNQVLGGPESPTQPALAEEALRRLRQLIRCLVEAGDKDLDGAEAAADRAELRLAGERKVANALARLGQATDLSSYLAAAGDAAALTIGDKSNLSARASFVFGQAPVLQALPRSALAPRVGAMWDAAPTADPQGLFSPATLNEAEQRGFRALADTSLADTLRRGSLGLYSVRGALTGRGIFLVGEILETRNRISDGTEVVQRFRELTREGAVSEVSLSRREFTNGVRAGEELINLLPIRELEFIRQVSRFQDAKTGKLLEPPLRTMDRIRRSDSPYPELRAYQLQEIFRLVSLRPEAWGLLFSPTAQRDADQLRRITQNGLRPYDFLFKDKWTDLQPELRAFVARTSGIGYAEEARFWRAAFAQLRGGRLIFAGMIGPDGQPKLGESIRNTVLYGLGNDGQAAVLFRVGDDGSLRRLADAAPLTPLLRFSASVAEAAAAAGIPENLPVPEGGWEALLQGRDL